MKRLALIIILFLLLLFTIFFRNIIYAFICNSEHIDKYTLSVMEQGILKSTKNISVTIHEKTYEVPLPKQCGTLEENKYIIPKASWNKYIEHLKKTEWNQIEQNGSSLTLSNSLKETIYISIKQYTRAYLVLQYNGLNNQ